MKFMTQGTLSNLPAYLADDKARRAEAIALQDRKKQEEYVQLMRKLGSTFVSTGDFTPQGLKKFAEDNELSMPEMKGMVDMVMSFKQLEKQRQASLMSARPEGANYTEQVETAPGVRNYDKPAAVSAPNNIWARGADGVQTRVPDQVGVRSQPAPSGQTESTSAPEYMKYAVSTLGKSLGYSAQSGWPDKASERKFNVVAQNVDAIMKDKDPEEVNQVLFDTIQMYDTELAVATAVDRIPENTTFTTVREAKEYADKAVQAGATEDVIKEELVRLGWSEEQIKKIVKTSSTDVSAGLDEQNPLGL